ncbi:MAG TPA: helix-turn-helix transcriptional regulator [Catalimonadaceae bacterium]|nr:helix-turn-helix transcriptional regulator [Catalimonadaceae bacterium]HPI11769.1 helix-turn-helix transcriptional regulator [Catalimonadaceae bacterium]
MKRKSNLREIRDSIGITQPEMARILGLEPGMYAMIETNRRHLTGKHLDRLILLGKILHQANALPENPEPTENEKMDILYEMLIFARAEQIRKESFHQKKDMKESARPRLIFLLQHFDQMAHPDFNPETDAAMAKSLQPSDSMDKPTSITTRKSWQQKLELEILRLKIEFLEKEKLALSAGNKGTYD